MVLMILSYGPAFLYSPYAISYDVMSPLGTAGGFHEIPIN